LLIATIIPGRGLGAGGDWGRRIKEKTMEGVWMGAGEAGKWVGR